jgi:hypothetical protein
MISLKLLVKSRLSSGNSWLSGQGLSLLPLDLYGVRSTSPQDCRDGFLEETPDRY